MKARTKKLLFLPSKRIATKAHPVKMKEMRKLKKFSIAFDKMMRLLAKQFSEQLVSEKK